MFLVRIEQCVDQEFTLDRWAYFAYRDAILAGWNASLFWGAFRCIFKKLVRWHCWVLMDGFPSIMARGIGMTPLCALRHALGTDP